ncbi:MAG: ArsI/CadI family heavy metal resistance metalloenzyme [Limisphaerales bacterium]
MKQDTAVEFPGNSRIHIALAARNLFRSRMFYETLMGVAPSKERPGYVKFEPQDPSVNLTLNEVEKAEGTSSLPTHFGVQVKSTTAVAAAIERLEKAGLKISVEENTTCCYAVQDKVWASDPDGNQWEVFVVLEADPDQRKAEGSSCCVSEGSTEAACC